MTGARPRIGKLLGIALLAVVALALAASAPASALTPAWHLHAEDEPTNLTPGGQGEVWVLASNVGDAPASGASEPVSIGLKLPAGLSATAITGPGCSLGTLTCMFKGTLNPYQAIQIKLRVKVDPSLGPASTERIAATVEGGNAPKFAGALPVSVNTSPPSFGTSTFEVLPLNEDGTAATAAGSHPFELTTTLVLNQETELPIELPRDLSFHLPPGLVGNPNAAAQCTMANFFALVKETNLCSVASVVGVATVTVTEPKLGPDLIKTVPVFNLAPSAGEPARFGFEVLGRVPIVIDTAVRSGSDYGVDVGVRNATQTAGLLSSQVTFWGVPGDPRHDNARGWECVAGGEYAAQVGRPCPASGGLAEEPFLTLPGSCAANPQTEPVVFSMDMDSWTNPGDLVSSDYDWMNGEGGMLGFQGCGSLPFDPSISVVPEQHTTSTPTGLAIDVTVPQNTTLEADGLAEANVRDTTVTLPQGVELSPAAANGLVACSEEQVGFRGFNPTLAINEFDSAPAVCPDASKLGTVKIKTPLLSHELEGSLYLATPAPNGEASNNPFNSLVAVYLVAQDPVSGVLVKLAGEGHLDEGTLRIATTFKNTPQVPFEDLTIELFGGPRASVTTPARCGTYGTDASFVPWTGTATQNVLGPPEEFGISAGIGGSACPSGALPFAPGFLAGSTNERAGAYTSFNLEMIRPDGDQTLKSLTTHLPAGMAAMLSSVELCAEAQAAASACPAGSEIGQATAVAGLGSEPIVQEGGRVFITGPYRGAPFGIEIVTPAKAGPFDLGFVTVRSALFINEHDASATIVSDPLPTQIRGIPLQLKRVLVEVTRPGFQFNGTSCDPSSITGTIYGDEGAAAPVASPYKPSGCEALPFAPKLTASVTGQGSRVNGTTFTVRLASAGFGQSNIHKVLLQLPKVLPSRLETLKKACLSATFEANPASCSAESVIGTAMIHTPVLKNPLSGPAYLVSHGNAAFPDVEFVLQGEGIKLVVDGQTDIKNGATYSKFETAPDAPFTTFETILPAGPKSVLAIYNSANSEEPYSACGTKLEMPTTIISQSNKLIETETEISTTGCSGVRGSKTKKLSLRQRYVKALKTCRGRYKHNKPKRARCERKAHATYSAKAVAACRHAHKTPGKARKSCEMTARRVYAAHFARRRSSGR